jgi:large subunit ribosomal protein L10
MTSAAQNHRQDLVKELNRDLSGIDAAVLMKCTGVTVEDITKLRADLRKNEISFRVIKNTLASRAVGGTALESLKDSFKGPTALAYTGKDPVQMAKVLTAFAKAQEKKVEVLNGVLSGKLLSKVEVEQLANVPSREVLLGRLVGSLQSPYAGLVYTLSGVLRKLVYALDAVRRQKEEQGEAGGK